MAAADDFSAVPTYRGRAIVRDLQALARGDIRYPYSRAGDIPGAPALSADPALRRFVGDVSAADLDRLADADMADIIARLPDWRERGRTLIAHDTAPVTDYAAARSGDEAARDRLRASIAEGGYGEPDLAMASAWDHAEDLSGLTVAEAADALESYAQALAEDRMEYDLGDDEMDNEVRDYEEGDVAGRYAP
ncbi:MULTISPECIES: hypothetical protein [unclassified Aureimonas]|uniref:hypothetical protein n=1 Tax=unclassified Aureimonas TaxID=2615206 RepID=UPI0007839492|nr:MULTISPECIES: hypothetical protein [unclassified Aureimonas]